MSSVMVERRFHGPPQSANGGYACGRIAAFVDSDAAEVTLHKPPPLDRSLSVRAGNDGGVALYDGDVLIGTGHGTSVDIPPVDAPTIEQAQAASQRTFATEHHPLPTCFVCGPHRQHGDGLRIHVGPVEADDPDWCGVLAAPWTPHSSLADDAGLTRAEFVWAALDCPTAYASSSSAGMRIILLGRQAVHIHRRPQVGEPCVIAAREIGHEGRKYFSEAVLFDAHGSLMAECRATWIEVTPDVQKGMVR